MTDLLSKENPTTTLTHVRDIFKNLLTEKDQKKGKNIVKKRDSNKKRKVNNTKKRTKGKPMESSSSSSEVFISDLDSCEDCFDSSMGLRKRRKQSTQFSKIIRVAFANKVLIPAKKTGLSAKFVENGPMRHAG